MAGDGQLDEEVARPPATNRLPGATIAMVILVALALGIPTVTSAHRKGYEVFFSTIRSSDDGGTGHISGSIFIEVEPHPKEACIPRRGIKLYEVVPGPDRLLGSGRTDRFGGYEFTFPGGGPAERRLALKLERKVIRNDGRHLHFCAPQTATFDF